MLYSEQPTVLLARRLLNTIILINFENLNFIANIFRETHDFLVLTDPVVVCTYLKTTDRHFRDRGNVRHPTLMLLKCDLVKTSNTFLNPSFRIFAAGKVALFYFIPIYFTQFLLKSFYWINWVISFVCKFFFGFGTINNKIKYEEYEKVRVCVIWLIAQALFLVIRVDFFTVIYHFAFIKVKDINVKVSNQD